MPVPAPNPTAWWPIAWRPTTGWRRWLPTAMAAVAMLALGVFGSRSQAQDVGVVTEPSAERESVQNRSRPEYDPEGFYLGQAIFGSDRSVDPETGLRLHTRIADSLILRPSLRTEVEYNDNIVSSSIISLSDVILRVSPRLNLVSDWDNHQFRASAGLTVQRYRENHFENADLWDVSVGGRLNVTEFHEVDLSMQVVRSQERLTSQDLLAAGAQNLTVESFYPVPLTTLFLTGTSAYQRDAFVSRFMATARRYDYRNVPEAPNPADRNQDDRDRWEYEVSWRAGYEAFEDTIVYVEPAANMRRYAITPDDFGFERNSQGGRILFGLQYNASAVSYLDAAIGYEAQNYSDARLPQLSGPTARLVLTWNATELLTLTAIAQRRLTEQILNTAGGQEDTILALRADQEIYYRTILSGGYQVRREVTKSNGLVEGYTQTNHGIDLGLRHLLNEYASIEGFLRHTRNTANLPSLEYDATSFGFSINLNI